MSPKISNPNASRDGHETWVQRYEVDGRYTIGTGIWRDDEYIYTCGYQMGMSVRDLIVIKWDDSGQIIWEYNYDSYDNALGFDIWGDEEYLYICGNSEKNHLGQYLLVKIDKDGNEIWCKEWGVPHFNVQLNQIQGDDTSIYVLGRTFHFPENLTEIVLMKYDKDGNVLWNNTWEDNKRNWDTGLIADTSNLYMCGYIYDYDALDFKILTIKWDKEGNKLWNRTSMTTVPVFIGDIDLDGEDIYLCGVIETENKTIGHLWKMNKEATILWNRSIEVADYTYAAGICCNDKEIFVCGQALSGEGFEQVSSFFLSRWDKNGGFNSLHVGSNEPSLNAYEYCDLWADEKNLYLCGSFSNYILILAKWDISKNYFARIGIPVIAIGISVIVSWVVIKPLYRLNKKRVQRKLSKISEDVKVGENYDKSYSELENMLSEVDRFKDPALEEKWHTLHNVSEVNRDFQKELTNLRKQVQEGNLDSAHSGLMNLLKKSHKPKYEGILDKRIESEITETLKQVSEEIKGRE